MPGFMPRHDFLRKRLQRPVARAGRPVVLFPFQKNHQRTGPSQKRTVCRVPLCRSGHAPGTFAAVYPSGADCR